MSVANVYVSAIADDEEDMVAKLYTFFPYNEKTCGKVGPIVVNEYRNNGFVFEQNAFVDKFENMHKCNLSLATIAVYPLVYESTDANGKPYLNGIEGNVMNYIANVMNFTIDIKYLPFNKRFRADALNMVWLM